MFARNDQMGVNIMEADLGLAKHPSQQCTYTLISCVGQAQQLLSQMIHLFLVFIPFLSP
jgi:hypothetical protein